MSERSKAQQAASRRNAAIARASRKPGWEDKLKTHGMTGTPLYYVWRGIINRCTNPKVKSYSDYGGRGITVCDRWRDFQNFYDDMQESYERHKSANTTTTIDRIDNDGNYEPSNCRWATRLEQASNTTQVRMVTLGGETHAVAEWCRRLNLQDSVVYRRIKAGMSIEDALTKSRYKAHLISLNGMTLNVAQWTAKMGFKDTTIFDRLKYGWTEYEAVMTPVGGKRATTKGSRDSE
jgi:hypothetical protein